MFRLVQAELHADLAAKDPLRAQVVRRGGARFEPKSRADIDAALMADPRLAGNPAALKSARQEAKVLFEENENAVKARDDDTMADYLATNDEARMEKRTSFLGPWIKELTGVTLSDAALRQAVSVNEAFLAEAFKAVTQVADGGGFKIFEARK